MKKLKAWLNVIRLNTLSFLRKLRINLVIDKHVVEHFKINYACRRKWYGNSYGGFYLNPDLIDENSVIYSFGIGKDISFDRKVMRKHRCKVFGFDPTPKSIDYINGIRISPLFHFFPFGISTSTKMEDFYLPKNKAVSGSVIMSDFTDREKTIRVQMKTFSDIVAELGHEKIDVVKMDIEGLEYEVIESILKSGVQIRQFLVEFHDRMFDDEKVKSKQTVDLLSHYGYKLFAVSLSYEEVSFIKPGL
jgi:FkbM family methyltransferase